MFKRIGGSKAGQTSKGLFDKAWSAADKYIGAPMNKYAGKMGIEGVWPTTMDKECDKAARILRVFTLDGGVETEEKLNVEDVDAKKKTQRVLKRIPAKALREAKGIAIFTVFRSGLGLSAASGSGIVIARRQDGTWGSPSGLLVHTIGFGFMFGIDVYDVVLLLRTDMAVKSFSHAKVSLGGELALVAGPLGSAAMVDTAYQQAPAWSYVKSKGLFAGVGLDGSIIIERQDENKRFYGASYTAAEILEGRVHRPLDVEGLIQTIEAASDRDTKTDQIPQGLAPSEATGGVLDHSEKGKLVQPTDGFGAPPSYEDLEEIKVKCSDCGESMSMEELGLHDCSSTTIKAASPSAERRAVPPPPPKKDNSSPELSKSPVDDTVANTSEQDPPKPHVEATEIPSIAILNETVDTDLSQPVPKASDAALVTNLEEVHLDDDLNDDTKIEMTIEDPDIKADHKKEASNAATPEAELEQTQSKSPTLSDSSFKSAEETAH